MGKKKNKNKNKNKGAKNQHQTQQKKKNKNKNNTKKAKKNKYSKFSNQFDKHGNSSSDPISEIVVRGKKNRKFNKRDRKRRKKAMKQAGGYKHDIEKLSKVLNPLGLFIKPVKSDGNCCWRSIADQLCDDQEKWRFYKNQTLKFIEKNSDYFTPFLTEELDGYLEEMKEDDTWAGDMELFAFSKAFEKSVIIHQNDKANLEFKNEQNNDAIHLSYHLNEHYNSVKKTNSFNEDSIKRGVNKEREKKRMEEEEEKMKKECVIPYMQIPFIMESTGCKNIAYMEKVYIEQGYNINETVQFLLMERNIYEARNVSEDDFWSDVKVEKKKKNEKKDEFVKVNVKKKPKLTKKEKKELEKKRKKEEAKRRKEKYLTKKQRNARELKKQKHEELLKKNMEKYKKKDNDDDVIDEIHDDFVEEQNYNYNENSGNDEPVKHIETIQL